MVSMKEYFQAVVRTTTSIDALPDVVESFDQYKILYQLSINNPDLFWKLAAQRLDWYRFPTEIKNTEFDFRTNRGVDIKWYEDGIINVCYNCLDRHIEKDPDNATQVALIFEADAPTDIRHTITYGELLKQVKQFANLLKRHGIKRGDRATIYMPMIIETCVCLLACARLGVIHSVVFAGFSPSSLAERIADCESNFIVTCDLGVRGGKTIVLKSKVDQALRMPQCQNVKTVLVFRRNANLNDNCSPVNDDSFEWKPGRDFWVDEELQFVDDDCSCEPMKAEDPLFILYTSGSTGKPKGILHTTGGYLVYTSLAFKYTFAYQPGDIYMCTADFGWITGHSCNIYGPLSNRAIAVIFEGIPTYPTVSRLWEIIDKYRITTFYTAPTVIRSLMAHDDSYVKQTSRKSLKIIGTAGEPINPAAWQWYFDVVGDSRCPVIDSWWQTETGCCMITPLPGLWPLEPGSATLPFFGIQTAVFDQTSDQLTTTTKQGELCIQDSWPGQARSLYKNHERFVDIYFKPYPGYYFTGDGCEIKANGYHIITGRVDDVLVISGHNIGTAEVESALVQHRSVSEAAVVGFPDLRKNQGMYCFVSLKDHVEESDELKAELIKAVRDLIGAHVYPDIIQFAKNLPKTRSGKIMRRILRKIVEPDLENLGDTSTLNDPTVVEEIIQNCPRAKIDRKDALTT